MKPNWVRAKLALRIISYQESMKTVPPTIRAGYHKPGSQNPHK